MVQLFKIFKILTVSSFLLIFDDVTLTLSLVVLLSFFLLGLIFVLSYSIANLLRLNVIFIVGKIDLESQGGEGWLPPLAPSLCLILEPDRRSDLKNFFMDRCPKDEHTAKNLVCKRSSSHFPEKLEKHVGGGIHPLGHWRVKYLTERGQFGLPRVFFKTSGRRKDFSMEFYVFLQYEIRQ